MYYRRVKYILDPVIAFLLFLGVWPILLSIIVLLIVCSPIRWQEVFFVQERIGYSEAPFKVFKLSTMKDGKPFFVGHLLRLSGLDELPQLLNIIKGEMSFIGPRPLLPEYLSVYTDEQKKRHSVKPGVLGLVQVNGGKSLDWDKRMSLDVQYVQNLSFRSDIIILLKTVWIYISFRKFLETDNRQEFKR